MYKWNCNRFCFVEVSAWHHTKRIHNGSPRVALWAAASSWRTACVSSHSHYLCVGRVTAVILLPTQNAHSSTCARFNDRDWEMVFVWSFYEGGCVLTSGAAHSSPGVCCTCGQYAVPGLSCVNSFWGVWMRTLLSSYLTLEQPEWVTGKWLTGKWSDQVELCGEGVCSLSGRQEGLNRPVPTHSPHLQQLGLAFEIQQY